MIDIVINGATGRMGRAVAAACIDSGDCRVVAGVAGSDGGVVEGWPDAVMHGDLPNVQVPFHVVIDFSTPDAAVAVARHCAGLGRPLVSGTTGLGADQRSALAKAARDVPLVHAPNMSAGVTLLLDLVGRAAGALGADADTEILEAHHRHKKDAPSGTALRLGEAVAGARGAELDGLAVFDRTASGAERRRGSIGFAVVRAADIVGEHRVLFALPGERLELSHRATDRAIFARGALRAARWLVDRQPGLFDMRDVLGL